MRIEVGFNQGPSINGINFKVICRCCGKNVFKDPDDDDDGFVSSFGTLKNAMMSLNMACYYHRLKSVVAFGTKIVMQWNLSGISCFTLYQKRKKNLNLITFDFALLTNLSWILILEIINSMFILLLVNKSTRDLWRIGNYAGTTMGIIIKMTVQFLILWKWWKWNTYLFKIMSDKWIDLYPQNDAGDESDLQLLCSTHHICMINWYDEEYNFWPTGINLSSAEDNWLEEEVVQKGFKRFTQTCLVPYYMALRMRKK